MGNLSESTLKETILRGYLAGTVVTIVGVILQYISVNAATNSISLQTAVESAWSPTRATSYLLFYQMGNALFWMGLGMIAITFAVRQFSVFVKRQD